MLPTGTGSGMEYNEQLQSMMQMAGTSQNQAVMQVPQIYKPQTYSQQTGSPISVPPYQGNLQQARNAPTNLIVNNPIYNDENIISDEDLSNDDITDNSGSKHQWQQLKKKRKRGPRTSSSSATPVTSPIIIQNRFNPLETDKSDKPLNNGNNNINEPKTPKPPPIFIYGVNNFKEMVDYLSTFTEKDTYYTKALADETIKVNAHSIDTYRKIIRNLKDENIIHHTYQIKDDRAYRIVIRNLHYSVPLGDIKKELQTEGHIVRNIMNIKHRQSREPLNLFFVDLEPQNNNKDIYELKHLFNTKITIEAPRKYRGIIQCSRCQQYGHSKTYCNKPYNCVKCASQHPTTTCTKARNTAAKCVLCQGNHPANYRGCTVYKDLVTKRNTSMQNTYRKPQSTANNQQVYHPTPNTSTYRPPPGRPSYAQTVSNNTRNNVTNNETTTDEGHQLTVFLNEFKSMFTQLMNQNSMILNLLTTVVNKLCP